MRPMWATVDIEALAHNTALIRRMASPSLVCAVVKADGYGHGAVEVARGCITGGAAWLAVAVVDEGIELREAGVEGPVLLLSEPEGDAMREAVAKGLTPTVYSWEGLAAARDAARASGHEVALHVKADTGMHRVGLRPDEAVALAAEVSSAPGLRLGGFWTHLAVAEDLDDGFTDEQVARFDEALGRLRRLGVAPGLVHAANSAGAVGHPGTRFDMVRCGIAVYGYSPSPAVARLVEEETGETLRPVLSLRARVSHVQQLEAGECVSYGRRYRVSEPSVVATVPAGYADGVPRALADAGGEVIVGGCRRPLAGTVTMDQLMVDCGPGAGVVRGDEVVLIGSSGGEVVTADEWAERTGTISYEILTGIGSRVPRKVVSATLVDKG
jgi:alanine racemase